MGVIKEFGGCDVNFLTPVMFSRRIVQITFQVYFLNHSKESGYFT
jgi:hypothetical protein